MSRTLSIVGLVVMLGAGAAQLPALAQKPDKAVAAVERRQSMMRGQRDALKSLVLFSKGTRADKQEAKVASISLNQIARQLPNLFPAGTGVGVGDSKAKPEIWTQRPLFNQKAAAMKAAAALMLRAANSGNKDKIAQALPAVSDACKGCHTSFQERP